MSSSTSQSEYAFLKPDESGKLLGTLAHYAVVREMGRGGMGFVFEAIDSKLKRTVALKVMNQKIAAVPGSRKRFLAEARSMAAVHHDNVATIFEVGESGGTPFMAMEMLKGETLEAVNGRSKLMGFKEIIRIASQMASGLAAAHKRKIVHRDIKPANIWIESGTQRVKILDFGLALASTPVDQLAGRGAVIGTPGYLSPEQARSDPLDDRSDLYSLGVVLYQLSTGKLPIESDSIPEQLISILAHRPTPVNEVNSSIPQPLCDTIHKLLRKEPKSRFASASALEKHLVDVEKECEKNSELADAISRLQMGLDQVKQPNEERLVAEPEFDSLAGLPDPLAVETPVATVDQALQAAASQPTRVIGTPKRTGNPSAAKSKNVSTSNGIKPYIPLICVAALILLALPVMTYVFTGMGSSDDAYVIDIPDNDISSPGNNASSNDASQAAIAAESASETNTTQQGNNARDTDVAPEPMRSNEARDSRSKPEREALGNRSRRRRNKPQQESASKSGKPEFSAAPTASTSMAPSNVPQPGRPSSSDSVSMPRSNAPRPLEPTLTPIPKPTRLLTISSATGNGADAMVQAGNSEPMGENPSLGIRRRADKDANHSYVRFDLQEVADFKKSIMDVRLVLRTVAGKPASGAELEVYGIEGVGNWPEDRILWSNSPSDADATKPLQSFPLLAEHIEGISGAESDDVEDDVYEEAAISLRATMSTPGVIVVRSDQLTEFVKSADATTTIAIAGSWKHRLLRFISRDRDPSQAPTLEILLGDIGE